MSEQAFIQPFEYEDWVTGQRIQIEVTPYYSKLIIDKRVYYFVKETGKFDGTSGGIN